MNPDSAYKYTCGSCKVKVEATQQMFISEPPKVISIHLKRFDIVGHKIGKPIQLSQILDINPFLHDQKKKCENYELCSFITHRGATSDSGHYVAICKEINGLIYEFNDNWVRQKSLQEVLQKTDSYILFYEKVNPNRQQIPSAANIPTSNHFQNAPMGATNSASG